MMSAENIIRDRLTSALQPIRLEIVNESEMHAGHRSSPDTGESHFRVFVVAQAFAGKSRVERHRMVTDLLKDELRQRIHAFALSAHAPGEPGAAGRP